MEEILSNIDGAVKSGIKKARLKAENDGWIDAEKQDPPYSEWGERYLVILISKARSNHAKDFAGRGKPEIATWCNRFDSSYKWACRGSLSVAYWRPMPEFTRKWIKGAEGEEARFDK